MLTTDINTMTKLNSKKISKLQHRLNGTSPAVKQKHRILPRLNKNYEYSDAVSHTSKDKQTPAFPFVAFMGVREVRGMDTKDTPVISMSDECIAFPDAKETLRLQFNPGEIERSMVFEILEFIERHKDAPKIIVHCTYGEQRSRAVAHAIRRILDTINNSEMGIYRFYMDMWVDSSNDFDYGDESTFNAIYKTWHRQLVEKKSAAA